MKEEELKKLATKYDLPLDFVSHLWDIVTDKENFEKGLKMFNAGTLEMKDATGNEQICIADIRKKICGNFQEMRKRMKSRFDKARKEYEYYNSCKLIKYAPKGNNYPVEHVFIKDGVIVAFAHYEPNQGGIYAAHNECNIFNWNPHEHLARIRKLDKQFYKRIKKAADKSPVEWFDFNQK